MIYKTLQLVGYKRLLHNNIESFTIEPTEQTQLILGTNGSGKSSLLQELSPMPGNAADFSEGGGKYISFEYNNNMYDLSSTFGEKQSHSFYKNGGDNLNPGGGLTTQKDLVKQEFGITAEIHGLMISQNSLSAMSTSDRRYWFTKLSDTNYDYAISVYNKLKERHRDIVGSLKRSKRRLVTETAAIIPEDQRLTMEIETEKLYDLLQHLMEYRKPLVKRPQEYERIEKEIENNIISLFNTLTKNKKKHFGSTLTIEQTEEQIQSILSKTQVEKILSETYFNEHEALNKTLESLKTTGGKGSQSFNGQLCDLRSKIEEIKNNKKLGIVLTGTTSVSNAINALDTVYDTLTTVFSTLPPNTEKKYSRTTLQDTNEKLKVLKTQHEAYLSSLNKLEVVKKSQEHQKSHDQTECPQCHHKWVKGFDQTYYDNVCAEIDTLYEAIDEKTSEVQEVKDLLEEITEYSVNYKSFLSCINAWPNLKGLWDYLFSTSVIVDNPRMVLNILILFKEDLVLDASIEAVQKEIESVSQLLELSKKLGEADVTKIENELVVIDVKLTTSTAKITELSTELKKLTIYKSDILDILSIAQQIETLSFSFTVQYTEHKEAFRIDALHDAIKAVQIILSNKQKTLTEMKVQVSVIKDIESEILIQEQEEVVYKTLIKELSPVDGLIAQGLTGFINSFVKQMNSFIKKIWTYPLRVVSCGVSDDGSLELDYKFPLIAKDSHPVSDVSKGSSAMKEIIDLAFKLTAMKYLDLQDYPIFLDEFARGMDSAHRVTSIEAIKSLMESSSSSQLFMISHYENSYSCLVNAQICVICPENIVIPKDAVVNQHVTIK